MNFASQPYRKWMLLGFSALLAFTLSCPKAAGAGAADQGKQTEPTAAQIQQERRAMLQEISELTQVPWTYLAALDQYERTVTPKSKQERLKGKLIGLNPRPEFWAGALNPNPSDTHPTTIALFGGIGRDGNGDGMANPDDDRDAMYSLAAYMKSAGLTEEDFQISLWRYYQNERAVSRIRQFATLYQTFDTLDLSKSSFVLPLSSSYSYRSTWGDRRGFGGLRIHEGTDLFASYGVPVRSACYGIVETKGWNRFGGWRIGIRDIQNRYHYYAHLQGFDKQIEVGGTVTPGQVIGWVGSSGYGGPGTSGKFPPHLHYGIYRDTGSHEWAFDPYPLLKRWENEERRKR